MNIVWLSWKDHLHPLAGGAETVSAEIMGRLVRDGHSVCHITAKYAGAKQEEDLDGVRTIRAGGRYSVYVAAWRYYSKELKGWADTVIDEMNTIPFASGFYSGQRNILLAYQLAREVWFHQMPFPLSIIGYCCEAIYLRLMSRRYPLVMTESSSTKRDMIRFGFPSIAIHLFRIGIALQPVNELGEKYSPDTILSLGAVRPMKRTLDMIKAFEHAHDQNQNLRLVVAGDISSAYGKKIERYVLRSESRDAITIRGKVSAKERLQLMQRAKVLLVASVKEGWGLVVTEANSQGTPAIAYNADGLRDSVEDGVTGFLVANGDHQAMGDKIVELMKDPRTYRRLRQSAWQRSKEFTFEHSYRDFLEIITS